MDVIKAKKPATQRELNYGLFVAVEGGFEPPRGS